MRLASELAIDPGSVTLAGGQRLNIDESNGLKLDTSHRSDVDRLTQSALMDAGRTIGLAHYDNQTDTGSLLPGKNGLNPAGMQGLMHQLLGDNRDRVLIPTVNGFRLPIPGLDPDTVLARIAKATEQGK